MYIFWESQMKNIIREPNQQAQSTVRQNGFGKRALLCVFWSQRIVAWYEPLKKVKQCLIQYTNNNWPIWFFLCVKNARNVILSNIKWFFLMIVLWYTENSHSGIWCPIRLTHQTWCHQATTYFRRWDTHLKNSLTKIWKTSSMAGYVAKEEHFFLFWRGVHKLLEWSEKFVARNSQYFEE